LKKPTRYNDNFITAKPKSEKISRYISYYYFHKSEDENYHKNFIFYPNYKHALTVYKDSKITLKDNESVVNPSGKIDIRPLYTINKDKNMKVSMKGRFNKIGIVFNPLGINHFIEKPLQEVFTDNFDFFPYFGDNFTQVIEQVFSEKEVSKKVLFLDEFFEQKYISFNELVLKRTIGKLLFPTEL